MQWYKNHAHLAKFNKREGNWEFPRSDGKIGFACVIRIEHIHHLLIDSRLKMIDLCDIAWKGKHLFPHYTGDNCYCCKGESDPKNKNADPSYPGIILENAPNPYDNKYRMIDGRHRIMKLLHSGVTSSQYYVLDYDEIKKFILLRTYSIREEKFVYEEFKVE
jgi:hypothetical protein